LNRFVDKAVRNGFLIMEPDIQSSVTSHMIRGLQDDTRIVFYLPIPIFFLILIIIPSFPTRLCSHNDPDQAACLKSWNF